MRILHAIHSANVRGGGPIEGIKQLSTHNVAAGHSVEVLSLDDPAESWIASFPLRLHAVGPSYTSYGYTPRLVPWLQENHHKYDVIVINGIWQYNSFGVWRVLRNASTPYCLFTHGMLDPWFKRKYPLKHLKKWMYWPWAEYRVLRDALAVFFTTEEERRLARRSFWLYHCDEIVISYGIAGAEGEPDLQRTLFFEKFPETKGKELVLFLGRLHEKKACDLLLISFAKAVQNPDGNAARRANLHLVLAGGGSDDYISSLRSLARNLGISDRITWTGMVTGDLKWGAFHAADVFFLVSHQENFGIAVAEALSCRLPVLISNRVNIWREVKLHNAGLIEDDDLKGAVRILEDWIAIPADARARMRESAAHCFDRCFNVAYFADSFIKALKLLGLPD